jgi:glycosyltransferase involved in cell wall biosynthesis
MRIVQLYKDYPPVRGGIESSLQLLAEGLAARGHQVTVLVTAAGLHGRRERRNGVEIVWCGRWAAPAGTPLAPAYLPALLAQPADLLHLHHPYPPADAALLLRRTPLVVTYHADVVRQRRLAQLLAPLLQQTLRRARRIIVGSPQAVTAHPALAAHRDRLRVVPFAVDLDQLTLPAAAPRILALRQAHPGPLLLFLGRLRYYKGLFVLLDALARLPDAQLAIAGADATVTAAELQHYAAQRGIAERIHLLGSVSDDERRTLLQQARALVLPSIAPAEAFGLVQVEAQAVATACVTTALGTGTDFVTLHEQTGLVVPPNDPAALAAALQRLVADPALAARFGAAGRARAVAEFSLPVMLDRVEQLYAEALQPPARR